MSDLPTTSETSQPPSGDEQPVVSRRPRITKTVFMAGAGLALITIIGVVLVFLFVADQRERDLRSWQVRMGIVADSRFAVVNGWLEAQFGEMRGLAENASLQLYLTELVLFAGETGQVTDEPAQRTYLRNLLLSRAEAGGFTAPLLGAEINANVERLGVAGIAIVDNDAKILVATPGMPPIVCGRLPGARSSPTPWLLKFCPSPPKPPSRAP